MNTVNNFEQFKKWKFKNVIFSIVNALDSQVHFGPVWSSIWENSIEQSSERAPTQASLMAESSKNGHSGCTLLLACLLKTDRNLY